MAKKLTPWFSGDMKPARVGVYERRFTGGDAIPWFSRWDGDTWRGNSRLPWGVAKARNTAIWMCLEWRGLASNPKKANHD